MNNEKENMALEEFSGNPLRCDVEKSCLDVSTCEIKANDCLDNAKNIAQQYPYCLIVEGILITKDKRDGAINCICHAWNYDTKSGAYFDFTIGKDEQLIGVKHEDMDYTYLECCQYDFDEVQREKRTTFKYLYNNLLDYIRSTFKRLYFRPRWTCGRYNSEKHVAIMYNLLAGYSFFFESYSADVIGHILAVNRDCEVNINNIANATGIAIESLQPFFMQLKEKGLFSDHIYNKEEIDNLRTQLAEAKKMQQSWGDKSVEEKLPMDTSSAEQRYFDAVDDGKTVCSVMFELTYRCSEKCIHCYNPGATRNDEEVSRRGDLQELTLDEYKHIIDDLNNNGLVKVCLSGGDPFSNKNAWDIIDYLHQKEIAFDVFTNGQRIINDVKRLADYFPRLVGVSIYSGVAEDHDAITRIPGSWNRSMRVVKELSELAVPMNLKCCIMQPNLHSYYMVANLAKEYGAQPQYEISITESNDGDLCAKQLRLTEEQLQIVLRDRNLALYVGKEAPNYGGRKHRMDMNACGAAGTSFCIIPNGNIKPCCAFPMDLGNIKMGIHNIFKSHKLEKWRSTPLQEYTDCGKYDYCEYCNICAGNNYIEHGDYRKPAETNCYIAKVRYNLAQKLKRNYTEYTKEQFVDALLSLPTAKVTLQRIYHTKG